MRTITCHLATASMTILLGSCVLGPDPASPDYKTPASIRGDAAPQGASSGDMAWRSVFTDPTLRGLIEKALKNNPDLVAATYRIEQARAQAASARSDWFPQLDGSAGGSANYGSRNAGQVAAGADRSSESHDLTGMLSWEIDLWGGIRRSNESARARLLATQYQRDAVQTTLVAAVASAYIELLGLDERLAIAKRTRDSREKSLDLVTNRRDGGVSSDLEVAQATASLGLARTAIPVTEQAIAAKENEIRALIGEFPGAIARGDALNFSMKIKGGLPSSLLERRPDIAAANQEWQAATADIGVAEALRLPSFSLTGSGGYISNSLDNLLDDRSAAYSIGPRLTGPIFDAGRGKARADAAKARAKEALAAHDRTAKQAFREAADSIHAHTKSGEILAEQSKLVEANRKVSSVAIDRYEGGRASYLEVLDAERNLFSSELNLADARRDRQLSVVQAYRALGGGWK